uniref:Nuclear factor connected with kappa-B-binding protein n=1 Tax=Cajanus cajan TaxID=3821 RepID=A0A151SV08_CAJCA|nr:Nuclear factor connected with kappa-B-binding protein [Cajanus cajan]
MAIEKNSCKVSRLDSECSPRSRKSMSSDEEVIRRHNSAVESEDDDGFVDADSGAGSDDFDLLELGGTGAEFCQIGNQTCSIPLELYDLAGLEDVLWVDVWNECLSEEERFELAKYLPDMDQETFVQTLKELFSGCNMHFGSPIKKLFEMLKGGLCEPRVALYREGLSFFQRRQHYHMLRKHQNNMVSNLCQIRDAWLNCRGYSIEERLRVLNIMRSQKSLMYEEDLVVDSSASVYHALNVNTGLNGSTSALSQQGKSMGYDSGLKFRKRDQLWNGNDNEEMSYGLTVHQDRNLLHSNRMDKSSFLKMAKRRDLLRGDEVDTDNLMGQSLSSRTDLHGYTRNSNQSSDMKNFREKPSSKKESPDLSCTAYRSSSPQVSDRLLPSGFRAKSLQERIRGASKQNGGKYAMPLRGNQMLLRNEETESDSSEQLGDDGDKNPLFQSKFAYMMDTAAENYLSKAKKGDLHNGGPFHKQDGRFIDDYPSGSDTHVDGDDDWRQVYKTGKNGRIHGKPMPLLNAYTAEKKKKERTELDHTILRSKYLHDYVGDEDGTLEVVDNNEVGQNDLNYLKRKSKKKIVAKMVSSEMDTSELCRTDMGTSNISLETKARKKAFTLITPTVHTGFSFSIIHLLSAVRLAMISPHAEDSLEMGKPREELNKAQEGSAMGDLSNNKMDTNYESADHLNMPSLSVHELVNRVRSNPGDPCILEMQEPLQDLVRGALKIFSSKTAPLGAKGWKVLAVFEKSTRSWSWTGPVIHNSPDPDTIEEVTTPEAWGLPHRMLVKLVDSFANWLKCGQETLQQIGSLPAPPLALMQVNLDEKERFRDLRAQKSLNTISHSSDEVKAYFRKEEVLRYSIPDRAFSYTAADGKKSIVAPLRRCGGKPTSKARDHFMLKHDRPPHVTILCLVRDAAARLPGSIGTRADVCTLIRDSQYIVEDVSDAQINQVVSGALDRLHYERDPCVQFDGERKLWVYLHREREEEDFEDDGTSSTKKWKRQKKDAADQSDQGTVTVAGHGTGEQSGYDLCSDLNVDPPPCIVDDKEMELLSTDIRLNADAHVDVNVASEEGNVCDGNSMAWEALDLNPTRSRELCHENSTNEDFDDESFGRERDVGLLSTNL